MIGRYATKDVAQTDGHGLKPVSNNEWSLMRHLAFSRDETYGCLLLRAVDDLDVLWPLVGSARSWLVIVPP